jgi:S-(hydroxymethyl)glutathione dehydrogenase/alcohol dehydrogenase
VSPRACSTVAVIGAGGVGLNVAQGARLAGAARVIVVDVNDAALEFAGRFGATDMVNPTHENALQRIRDLTGGAGVDYAFEVFGSAETITMALDATKKGGTAVVIGLTAMGEETGIDALQLVRQEKTLKGSYYGSAAPAVDMHRTVDLTTTGKIDVGGLITRRYRLDEINDAYEELARGAVGRGIIEF